MDCGIDDSLDARHAAPRHPALGTPHRTPHSVPAPRTAFAPLTAHVALRVVVECARETDMKLNRWTGAGVIAFAFASLGAVLGAQQAAPDPKDPRIGLKPGLRDAGTAAKNMELVANMPKPEGFFDPAAP